MSTFECLDIALTNNSYKQIIVLPLYPGMKIKHVFNWDIVPEVIDIMIRVMLFKNRYFSFCKVSDINANIKTVCAFVLCPDTIVHSDSF